MKLTKSETGTLLSLMEMGCQVIRNGWPDFTVILPTGETAFVESKSGPDSIIEPTPERRARMREIGLIK